MDYHIVHDIKIQVFINVCIWFQNPCFIQYPCFGCLYMLQNMDLTISPCYTVYVLKHGFSHFIKHVFFKSREKILSVEIFTLVNFGKIKNIAGFGSKGQFWTEVLIELSLFGWIVATTGRGISVLKCFLNFHQPHNSNLFFFLTTLL